METFDLGIAWDNDADNEFVGELNERALKEGLKPYLIHIYNFYASLKDITENKISFRFLLNRTSDDDPVFRGLPDFLKRKGITFINHPDKAKESRDKFKMHLKFNSHDISVPKTALLNPEDDRKSLELKIKYVSKPFVLRPADGYGEEAILDAQSLDDVIKLKEQHGDIKYIAQEKILHKSLENKPAWFRVFYCCGKVIPCWWHPKTHVYDILTMKQVYALGLYDMWYTARKISQVCKLNFFSAEVVIKDDEKFLVASLNDQPYMRRKSKFNDGVPDEIVDKVIQNIVSFIREKVK